MTAAIRMLAYGYSADCVDEYVRMSETTAMYYFKRFCKNIVEMYKDLYMRKPNQQDLEKLMKENEKRGFPGMIGSIDCTHWVWKNCPTAWQGQYIGKEGVPTVVLEAVASQNLWIWHAYFGAPGSLNDLNILDSSPIFADVVTGRSPKCPFEVNGNQYELSYYLADGIYPKYATFVRTVPCPSTQEECVRI